LTVRLFRTSSDGHAEELKYIPERRVAGFHFDRTAQFDGGAVKDGSALEVAEPGDVADSGVERAPVFVRP
jgi:hypothetical protein